MSNRWLPLWLVLVLSAGTVVLRAESWDSSHGGSSNTVTITYNPTTGNVTASYSITKSGDGAYYGAAWVYTTNGSGGPYGTQYFDLSAGASPNGATLASSVSIPVSVGQWFRVGVRTHETGSNTVVEGSNSVRYYQVQAPPDTYGITVNLPANLTTMRKDYIALQGGQQVGHTAQASGQSAREWYIGGLTSNAPVQVVEVVGGNVATDETGALGIIPGETEYKPVTPQATPTGETAPGSGATAETTATGGGDGALPSNPQTTAPTAPTATGTPTAPTSTAAPSAPTGVTPFSPSGTGGATKQDVEAAANKQLEGLESVADAVHTGATATVEATDKVASAVWESGKAGVASTDKVATAVWESGKANVEASNKLLSSVDGVRSSLVGVKTSVDAVKTAVDQHKAATEATTQAVNDLKQAMEDRQKSTADATSEANTATASAAAAGASAGSAASGLFSSLSAPSGSYSLTSSEPILAVTLPPSFGGQTFNLNPFSGDRFGVLASWFRAATAWLVLVLLATWVWLQIKDWMKGFSLVPQAKGNHVAAGTGAQATALVAAGLMTVAIVTATTALLSWTFGDITLGALRSVAMTNPLTSMPANAAWMLDQLFPLATIVSAAVARLSFNMYAAPLFATCAAVVRFVVP